MASLFGAIGKKLEDLAYNTFYGDVQKTTDRAVQASNQQAQAHKQMKAGQITPAQYTRSAAISANSIAPAYSAPQPQQYAPRPQAPNRPQIQAPRISDIPRPRLNPIQQLGQITKNINDATYGNAMKLGAQLPEFIMSGQDGKNFADNASDMLVGNTTKLINTANEGVVQPIVGAVQGKSEAEIKARMEKNLFSDRGGLNNNGTFFPTKDAYNKTFQDQGSFTRGFTGAGIGVATEVAPVLRGASLLAKPGLSTGQKIVRGGLEGGAWNIPATVAQQMVEQRPIDPVEIAQNAATGVILGGSIPAVVPTVKAAKAKSTANAASAGEKVSGIPRANILNDNEAYTLADFSDYIGKRHLTDTTNPKVVQDINILSQRAYHAAKQAGVDIQTGTARQIQDRIANYLERRDAFKQGYSQVAEGGYLAGPKALGFNEAKKQGLVFDGVDGKPRFEVDDSGAKIRNPNGNSLPEILDHPSLFNNYPELKDVKVARMSKSEAGARMANGSYNPDTKVLTLAPGLTGDKLKGTILHEISHKIDDIEGRGGGTSPEFVTQEARKRAAGIKKEIEAVGKSPIMKRFKKDSERLQGDLDGSIRLVSEYKKNPEYVKASKRLRDLNDKLRAEEDVANNPMPSYERNLSEAEARAVQARMNMTPGERYIVNNKKDLHQRSVETLGLSGHGSSSIPEPLLKEAAKYKNPQEFYDALANPRAYSGEIYPASHLKTPKKLYRGVSSEGTGVGSAGEGLGLYTTTDKKTAMGYAKDGGKLLEMNPQTDIPKNPLYFRSPDSVRSWIMRVSQKMGMRVSEFNEKVGIENLVQTLGHDGVAFDLGNGVAYAKYGENKVAGHAEVFNRVHPPSKPRSTFYDSLDVPKQDLIIKNGDGKAMSIDPEADYIKKIRQPIEKELRDAQAEMDKYGTGYINDIELAAKQAKAKFRLDRAKEADFQNTESKLRAKSASDARAFQAEFEKMSQLADVKALADKSEPWYKAREEIKANYIGKFKSADDFVADFNTNDGVIPRELKTTALTNRQYSSKEEIVKELTDLYNQAHSGKAMSVEPKKYSSKEFDALRNEARKYKTADEFVEASKSIDPRSIGIDAASKLFDGAEKTVDGVTKRLKEFYKEAQSKPTLQDALEGKSTKIKDQTTSTPVAKTPVETSQTQVSKTTQTPQAVAPEQSASVSSPTNVLQKEATQKTRGKTGLIKQEPQELSRTYPDNTTKQVKKRGFTETVKGSDEVSSEVRKKVSGEYNVRSTDKLAVSADKFAKGNLKKISDDVNSRLDKKLGTINDQDVADALAVAKRLDGQSRFNESQAIYDKLAEHGTKGGQTIQAFSLLRNRTPEGVKFQMLKNLKKAGVVLTKEDQKQVSKLIDNVRKTKVGTESRDRALYETLDFVSRRIPTSNPDKLVNFWRAGLLTAPKTTAGNLLGNSTEMATQKIWADPIAVGTDKFFSLFTGKRTKTYGTGTVSGVKEGVVKGADYLKTGFDTRNMPNAKYDAPRRVNYNNKLLDTYVNGVYRWMGAQDQPFYYAAKASAAHDLAKADGINLKLKGEELANYIEKSVANPEWKPQTFKTAKDVTDYAKYAVYQNETMLGSMASGLKNGAGRFKGGRAITDFVLPFTQVPSSIAMRIIDRTPIGTAREVISQIKRGSFDQRAMAEAVGNGSFGIPVIAAGYALASNGEITGAYPSDSKERKLWEAQGKQPYSVRVGDRWYSLNYMQPFGTLMAIGKQVSDDKKDGKSDAEAWMNASGAAAKSVESQSFLKGLNGVLSAINEPERSMGQFVKSTASSIMPNFIRSGATAIDPMQRETKTPLDAFTGAIPGVRQTLPTKRDMFGKDLKANDNPLNQYINPLRPSRVKGQDDATIQELQRLQDTKNGIVTTTFAKNSIAGVELNDKQIRDLNQRVNSQVKERWDVAISSPDYQAMSDEDKATTLKKIKDSVANNVKGQFVSENKIQSTKEYKPTEIADVPTSSSSSPSGIRKGKEDTGWMDEYNAAKSKFEKESKNWNEVERAKKAKELASLEVKKNFSKEATSLYDMAERDIYGFLDKQDDKKAQHYLNQIVDYGDKMVAAGLWSTNKLKDKYGNVQYDRGYVAKNGKVAKGAKSSGGRKATGRKASTGRKATGRKSSGGGRRGGDATSGAALLALQTSVNKIKTPRTTGKTPMPKSNLPTPPQFNKKNLRKFAVKGAKLTAKKARA